MSNDNVFALTDSERYNTGYSWGCSDARKGGHPYLISHPTHTPIFMNGYDKGYASCSSGNAPLTNSERYNTGYSWGCSDARKGGHPYLISHPTHTPIFMNGYDKGYASCSSGNTQTPSTASSVNRNNMFSDQNMCKSVQKYLIKPCSSYVKSNGVLTDEGIGAKRCISNGMLLSAL